MENKIRFYREVVYGNELMYPVDQKQAIWTMTGKKTITPRVKLGMEALGFTFVEVLKSSIKGGV